MITFDSPDPYIHESNEFKKLYQKASPKTKRKLIMYPGQFGFFPKVKKKPKTLMFPVIHDFKITSNSSIIDFGNNELRNKLIGTKCYIKYFLIDSKNEFLEGKYLFVKFDGITLSNKIRDDYHFLTHITMGFIDTFIGIIEKIENSSIIINEKHMKENKNIKSFEIYGRLLFEKL